MTVVPERLICEAKTKKGVRCKRPAEWRRFGYLLCHGHRMVDVSYDQPADPITTHFIPAMLLVRGETEAQAAVAIRDLLGLLDENTLEKFVLPNHQDAIGGHDEGERLIFTKTNLCERSYMAGQICCLPYGHEGSHR